MIAQYTYVTHLAQIQLNHLQSSQNFKLLIVHQSRILCKVVLYSFSKRKLKAFQLPKFLCISYQFIPNRLLKS